MHWVSVGPHRFNLEHVACIQPCEGEYNAGGAYVLFANQVPSIALSKEQHEALLEYLHAGHGAALVNVLDFAQHQRHERKRRATLCVCGHARSYHANRYCDGCGTECIFHERDAHPDAAGTGGAS